MKGFSETHPPVLGPVFELSQNRLRLCDIGPNIKNEMFHGLYNGKRRFHKNDMEQVLERAQSVGVTSMIFTGCNVKNSAQTLSFCSNHSAQSGFFCTAGIHPCYSTVFDQGGVESALVDLIKVIDAGLKANKLAALGEMGLDYDRLSRCSAAAQRLGFESQLELATHYDLPLFLHSRNASEDFIALLAKYRDRLPRGGVVHCFTGSAAELQALVEMGFYIGLTGASLRTQEGLVNATLVPDHLLLLETDAPWCGMKKSHASYRFIDTVFPSRPKERYEEGVLVDNRCEPCNMVQVLEVVAKLRRRDPFELAEQVYENTERLFPLIKREE
jgi:TatD DNase family protein